MALTQSLTPENVAPIYFVHGPESFFITHFVARLKEVVLRGAMAEFNYSRCRADETTGDKLTMAARSLPMMAARRLILVDDAERLKAADMPPLEAYLENPAPETCLVFLGTKFDLRRGLFAKANRKKYVHLAELLKEKEIAPFVAARAKNRGIKLASGAAQALSAAVGPDAAALNDALERLSLYAGTDDVTAEHVAEVVSFVRQNKVFDLTDALGSRNTARALALLEEFLFHREEPLRILALVARHMRQLIRARIVAEQRLPQAEMASLIGVPPFAVSKTIAQSQRFASGLHLESSLMRIARADLALKSSRRPPRLVLEEAIIDLCMLA